MPAPKLNAIAITIRTRYIEEQSDESKEQFVFSYVITITNEGQQAAQLMNRHWLITDGNGQTQEVKGAGVIGEQPSIQAGESYEYSSGTMLKTPVGTMHGSYEMHGADGSVFETPIPAFLLSVPNAIH